MENLTNWCVYMHTNRVNGKKYIGITGNKPTYRWNNGEGYKLQPLFYNAIKHYGWDAFSHDILYTGLSKEEAEHLEIAMIKKYNTQNKDVGYNLASGGYVNSGWNLSEEAKKKISKACKGHSVSEEARKRISESQKGNAHWLGKHHTEKTRQKLKKLRSGKGNGMYGRIVSDDVKERISEAMKGRKVGEETRRKIGESKAGSKNYNSKRVQCIETGKIYGSITDAANDTGVGKYGISKNCLGRALSAGGLHWKIYEAVSKIA